MERDTKPHRNSKEQATQHQNNSQEPDTETQDNLQGWEAPNAIFIHAYDKLTFEQKQVLSSYARTNGLPSSIELIEKLGNCFTQKDTPLFLDKQSDKLPADVFWKCIYMAVFWRLLNNKWLTYGSPFYYFLSSSIPCADVLLDRIRHWLLPESNLYTESSLVVSRNYLILRTTLHFCRHLYGITGTAACRSLWMVCPREKGIIISSFLIILYILDLILSARSRIHFENYKKSILLA